MIATRHRASSIKSMNVIVELVTKAREKMIARPKLDARQ